MTIYPPLREPRADPDAFRCPLSGTRESALHESDNVPRDPEAPKSLQTPIV